MVPDHLFVVEAVYEGGDYDLTTHEGHERFVDDVVLALHAHDPKWGHLIKKPGQTNIHGHGEDSALYKLPGNKAWAVDFIKGAGARPPYTPSNPEPSLRWGPDSVAHYKHSDWLDPALHGENGNPGHPPTPPAPQFPYPDEGTAVLAFQNRVKKAYNDVGRIFPDPNDSDAYRHFVRYGYSCDKMPEPEAAKKHIAELRAQLGAGPE